MKYSIKERRVFLSSFVALAKFKDNSIQLFASVLSLETHFKLPKQPRSTSFLVKKHIQTVLSLSFLGTYRELNCMLCPGGRGSSYDMPICFLRSDTNVSTAYQQYASIWPGFYT